MVGISKSSGPCSATILGRKFNSRESRLSIQSSTDDSVHSTSSSRNETDEETNGGVTAHLLHNNQPPSASSCSSASSFCSSMPAAAAMMRKHLVKSVASSVDDESGFSSMNSFQEIGLPVTTAGGVILDRSEDSSAAEDATIVEVQTNNGEFYGYAAAAEAQESDGGTVPIVHRRWSSAPPIPPKRNALSTFAKYNGDEALKVLWV